MKKLSLTVFTVICALCMIFGISLMANTNKANAETMAGITPTLSATNVMVSNAQDKMLLATAIKDKDDVYEVGYTFTGEITPSLSENGKYYSSITSGTTTLLPADIFDEDWAANDGVGMIIWEIPFSAGTPYGYKPYALVGDRVNGNLVVPATENRVTPENATEKTFYTVTFSANEAEYGSVSKMSVAVPSGSAISVSENVITVGGIAVNATKNTGNAQYTYGFTGFDYEGETVTANTTITANFTRTTNEYTVTFKNYNGAELQSGSVAYGIVPVYSGETPTMTNDAQYTYGEFTGWDSEIVTVTGDTVYTATYNNKTVNQYTITFEMGEGTAIDPIQKDYGTSVSELNDISVVPPTGYHFVKWQLKTGENTYEDFEGTETLVDDITVKAVYEINIYTVSIASNNVEYGTVDVASVASVPYGTVITTSNNTVNINGTTVTATLAESDAQYTYSFDGWTNGTATVTSAITITAKFKRTTNEYTVKFNDGTSDIDTQEVAYGSTAVAPSDPTKAGYEFMGWDGDITAPITGTTTFNAIWSITHITCYDGFTLDVARLNASETFINTVSDNKLVTNTGSSTIGNVRESRPEFTISGLSAGKYYNVSFNCNLTYIGANDNYMLVLYTSQTATGNYYYGIVSETAATSTTKSGTITVTKQANADGKIVFDGWYGSANLEIVWDISVELATATYTNYTLSFVNAYAKYDNPTVSNCDELSSVVNVSGKLITTTTHSIGNSRNSNPTKGPKLIIGGLTANTIYNISLNITVADGTLAFYNLANTVTNIGNTTKTVSITVKADSNGEAIWQNWYGTSGITITWNSVTVSVSSLTGYNGLTVDFIKVFNNDNFSNEINSSGKLVTTTTSSIGNARNQGNGPKLLIGGLDANTQYTITVSITTAGGILCYYNASNSGTNISSTTKSISFTVTTNGHGYAEWNNWYGQSGVTITWNSVSAVKAA
ncbi:MAG: InlB B-repeat-containing protein [Clostridia bacterium]|nr:InlB B-repeat-containing protein [Clostridia bacterium]